MMEDIFSEELVDVPDDIERVVEGGEDDIQNVSGKFKLVGNGVQIFSLNNKVEKQ